MLGERIREWHEAYGDDVILKCPNYYRDAGHSKEKLKELLEREWKMLQDAFPWAETRILLENVDSGAQRRRLSMRLLYPSRLEARQCGDGFAYGSCRSSAVRRFFEAEIQAARCMPSMSVAGAVLRGLSAKPAVERGDNGIDNGLFLPQLSPDLCVCS